MSSNEEIVKVTLLNLLKEEALLASCYKCNLPISYKEVITACCNKCGYIHFDRILFRAIVSENIS